MEAIVLEGQSLFDMSVQESGSVEGAFDLAVINDISVTNSLPVMPMLSKADTVDKRVLSYYMLKNIKPATDLTDMSKLGGIGYMGIKIDFIVS